MRVIRYNFLFVLGLVLTLGVSTVLAHADHDKKKQPKDMGTLSVKTTPDAMQVKVDGQDVGMSGVGTAAEFYLAPGFHTVEVIAPDGRVWKEEVEIRRNGKTCICLKLIRETITTPCPYRFSLEGPDKVMEGDLITFAAINSGTAPIPIRYDWKVSNGRITSGLGTPTITVDTAGMAGQMIDAELDVNDDVYDNKCRQVISVPTEVGKLPPAPTPFRCDEFEPGNRDQDKARLDNCVIQVQNTPDSQMYVIIYPGTDKRNPYDRTAKFYLDYMVKNRGMDPARIRMVRGDARRKTTAVIWVVPPGATPPTP
ncbi:MAG: PEGA domain-containing protein [Pyrinomonadaceae bacterium]